MYCKVPFNDCIFVIPNSLLKIVLLVMLLLRLLSARFYVVLAMLICLSAAVLAQSEKPDTCKVTESKPVVEQKQHQLNDEKHEKKKRKESDRIRRRSNGNATLESVVLFKIQPISKL